MPYSDDSVNSTMQDRIEEKIRDLLIASDDFDDIKVFYRGEPGWVPVHLHPFVIVFLTDEKEAIAEDGYGEATGLRHYRYDGFISVEVLHKDAVDLVPNPITRKADIPSYIAAKKLTQGGFKALMEWGGPNGHMEADQVFSDDGREATVELRMDAITNGLSRRKDNVSNRGTFNFHLYTRRLNY